MTERMKTWIKGFAGGVAVTVIVGGIGYFICFGSVPMIGEQGLSLSDLGKASKIAKLVDTYYLDTKKVMKTASIRWKKVCTVDW